MMEINNQMLDEIKSIECASDDVVDRLIAVLEHYNPTGEYQIITEPDEDFINDNIKVYNAYSESGEAPSITVVVKEGLDHYVAEVVDAYEAQ